MEGFGGVLDTEPAAHMFANDNDVDILFSRNYHLAPLFFTFSYIGL